MSGTAAPPDDAGPVLDLVAKLAGMVVAGSFEGTLLAERRLCAVARAFGHEAEVVVLPESATVTVAGRTRVLTAIPAVPPLDRVSALRDWLDEVCGGRMTLSEADNSLDRILNAPPPYGRLLRLLGVVLFTVGFGVSIQPSGQQIVFSTVLGVVVGLIMLAAEEWARVRWIAPLLASGIVAGAALFAADHGWITGGPIPLMLPALFVFIPGDSITMAMVELSSGRYTAGAARFVESLAALGVLAFGTVAALALFDFPADLLTDTGGPTTLGVFAGWLGWAVFIVGVMLVFAMRLRDLPWAMAVVLLTYGAQLLTVRAFGDLVGTWLAAAIMTVFCVLLERRRHAPPIYVLFLGAFFVLTPGSHGLRGLDSLIGGHPIHAASSVAEMFGLLVAVALGILTAVALIPPRFAWASEVEAAA